MQNTSPHPQNLASRICAARPPYIDEKSQHLQRYSPVVTDMNGYYMTSGSPPLQVSTVHQGPVPNSRPSTIQHIDHPQLNTHQLVPPVTRPPPVVQTSHQPLPPSISHNQQGLLPYSGSPIFYQLPQYHQLQQSRQPQRHQPQQPQQPPLSTSSLGAAIGPRDARSSNAPAELRKSSTPSTPAMSAGSHSSPVEATEVFTPVESGTLADAMVLTEGAPTQTNKRSSAQMLEISQLPEEPGIQKKVRLDDKAKPDPKLDNTDNDEDSDVEVIEIDTDGMRPVESCVAKIVESENNNGIYSCRICKRVSFHLTLCVY